MKISCTLLRHGKTKGNLEKRYIGCRTDEPLCEEGRIELENLIAESGLPFKETVAEDSVAGASASSGFASKDRHLTGRQEVPGVSAFTGFDAAECRETTVYTGGSSALLFVSPMLRARQTAEIFFPGKDQIVIPELMESDFGRFEGKNYWELNGDPDYQAWIDSGGTMAFPEGEAPEDFRKRSAAGFEKAVFHALENSVSGMYIVAHGGTVMSVMSALTGKPYFDFMVSCGQGYELLLEQKDGKLSLLSWHPFPAEKQEPLSD